MIIPQGKHLTDQEFYTFIKFFELVIEKKEFDSDDNTFSLTDIGIGGDEISSTFNRIVTNEHSINFPVNIKKGYNFKEEIKHAKEEAEKKPEKENLLKTLKNIEDSEKIRLHDISAISWIIDNEQCHGLTVGKLYTAGVVSEEYVQVRSDKNWGRSKTNFAKRRFIKT